jgi:site-specific recombinase XerD
MPLEPITPPDAVELYLQEKSNELAQATMYAHRSRLNHFLEWCAQEGIDNCNDLTGRKLHEFRTFRSTWLVTGRTCLLTCSRTTTTGEPSGRRWNNGGGTSIKSD